MYLNNSFNILPWYDSLAKRSSQKWYAFGQSWPLLCPKGRILPFQFVCEKIEILSTVFAVDVKTGAATDLKVTPTVLPSTQADTTYYVVKMPSTQVIELPVGLYYLRFNTSLGYLYSEEISIIDDAEECVKIEYWNEDTLKFTSGEINFEDNFKFELYLRTTIGKPEYEFEEELTKRLGYKFIESQTSNKLYKFAFVAPEYICDAMRLIRLCDYIKITTKFDSYNALSFAYEPKWQEQGDLAAVDAEFDTDCIIQKLESFNRRLRESFYNALLAEIDEPVLFSTDTVAQYYTEFTSTSYINGKLIRQLESMPISELRDSLADIVLPADNQSDNSQAAKKVFLSDILSLVEAISNYFKPHYSSDGQLEWIEALAHIGVRGGVTMYIDGGNLNLPSIYEGLPIDWKTLIRDANGVLMVNPDIELGGGATTWDELQGKPSWIGSSKPVYSYSEIQGAPDLSNYALSSDLTALSTKLNDFLEGSDTDTIINKWKELETFLSGLSQSDNLATILGNKAEKTDLAKYIPIAGATDITGEKNFTGGLKVNGIPIYYDTDKKYWKLEGDLLVTGGVTMYGNDSEFIPSTIMDAILYDDTTLGINAQGQLYVKGGTGDVSGDYLPLSGGVMTGWIGLPKGTAIYDGNTYTLFGFNTSGDDLLVGHNLHNLTIRSYDTTIQTRGGSLRHYNINTGVTSTILDSSNWSQYITAGDGGNYLPLSGGTLTGNLTFGVTNNTSYYDIDLSRNGNSIKISNTSYKLLLEYKYSSYATYHGLMVDEYGAHYTQRTDLAQAPTKYTLWHSGNDGSGSGLDADLLDGVHLNRDHKPYGKIPSIGADGVMEVGKYIDFHNDNTTGSDFSTRLICSGEHGNNVSLPSASGTLALTSSNVASATKLQTARTIWGQSFNGTGNVSGTLSGVNDIDFASKGNYVVGTFDKNANTVYTNNIHSGKGNNLWLKSTADTYITNSDGTIKFLTILSTGNVGIGTTNPTEKLDINGNCRANHFAIKGATIVDSNFPSIAMNYGNFISFGGYRAIRGEEAGLVLVAPSPNGGSIIFRPMGNTATSTQTSIDTNGNMLVSGGVTMYSDSRKKTILNHVELSLQQVANAPLIEHYYNSDQNKTTHVGSIAQYWAEMNDWFCKKDSEGYYTMEIQNAALASAISVARELVKFETETDRRIRLLEEENKRLKEEVEYLKLNIAA